MTSPLHIPDDALLYILFQRTAYLQFANTKIARLLRKVLPFVSYERMIALEAKLEAKLGSKFGTHPGKPTIAEQYTADMRSEYDSMSALLPTSCANILDIGCGIAGIDVFLQHHYQHQPSHPHFFLLDKSQLQTKVHYGFKQHGAFYNSLGLAKTVLVQNGVGASKITTLDATDDSAIPIPPPVDLVVSLISWGFHYPVETYVKTVHKLLAEQGRVILDVRKDTEGTACLNDWFSACQVIVDTPKYARIVCGK